MLLGTTLRTKQVLASLACALLFSILIPSFAAAQPGQATLVTAADAGASTFTWKSVPDATYYYLWVNEHETPKHQVWYRSADAGCARGEALCSVTVVLPNMNFVTGYWWIQTWSADGFGPWSSAQTFPIRPTKPAIFVDANNRLIGTRMSSYEVLIDIEGRPALAKFDPYAGFITDVVVLRYATADCAGQAYGGAGTRVDLEFTSGPDNVYLFRGPLHNGPWLSWRFAERNGTVGACVNDSRPRTIDARPATWMNLTSRFGAGTGPFMLVW